MAIYKLTYNATTKVANVVATGDATPNGSTSLGNIEADLTTIDDVEVPENHVLYHTVRDVLYKIGVQDMNNVTILFGLAAT